MSAAPLPTTPYLEQLARWPTQGRHILAHHDQASVIVYQAYQPQIARWSVQHQRLGGPGFRYERMSWIKPNFLWMMHRSGWATKPDQEHILALRLPRAFLEELLASAVPSSYQLALYPDELAWRQALQASQVRLQWDPDHDPHGNKQERRALQLGLRGSMLERLGQSELLEVLDLTDFVQGQRACVRRGELEALRLPTEAPLHPRSAQARHQIQLSAPRVHVVDPDPDWARRFQALQARLWPVVEGSALSLEHVGSTSVPQLAAKPVIDMDIVVRDRAQLEACAQRLAALGYQPRGELGIEGRFAMRRPAHSEPHNLYLCLEGCASLRNHLAVRDYLRAHPEEARAYGEKKKELAQRHPWDIDAYTWGKTGFLLDILGRCGFDLQELEAIREANRPST